MQNKNKKKQQTPKHTNNVIYKTRMFKILSSVQNIKNLQLKTLSKQPNKTNTGEIIIRIVFITCTIILAR